MSANTHVMLDIETMSSDSKGAIVQIGACVFNPATQDIGEPFEVNIKLGISRELGFDVDPDTERWWASQSEAAIASIMAEPRLHPKDALERFATWYPTGAVCWSHCTFDAVLMQNAYKRMGLRCPWHFRDTRDLRTLHALFGVGGRTVPEELWSPTDLTPHRASHDAIRQSRIAIYQIRRVLGVDK